MELLRWFRNLTVFGLSSDGEIIVSKNYSGKYDVFNTVAITLFYHLGKLHIDIMVNMKESAIFMGL